MKKILFLSMLMVAVSFHLRAYNEVTITSSARPGSFTLVGPSVAEKAVIVYDSEDSEVVKTAIDCFISDVRDVSRRTLVSYTTIPEGRNPIIVGTIGQSAFIDQLIASGKIDVSEVKDRWEAFAIETVKDPMEGVAQALVVYGSQPRSTAYAILELSRMMGVSPWIWWADVTPQAKSPLYVSEGKSVFGSPSVKFRGIFLNDEDYGLRPWAALNMDKNLNNFGPVTYGKIMELLLRLRANTLWPAMHAGSRAFWFEKTNIPLLSKYDIYMGSSHCEQMLRDNVYEWNKYGGHGDDDWNWKTNRDMVKRYWADRVGESRGHNAIYTLGMRGVHDTGMNGYSTTAERVSALTEIIAYQRQLIADSLGNPTTIPQIFIPYKEVLSAYNAGLKVPDDVTLMWVDDNHGYIRQMPSQSEQARSGGNAIYYHLSYWGTPDSYLWLSTISPSLCSYELSKAYDQGIRDQWIINVGDIKPAEEELEFCMDLAWDINSWTPDKAYLYTRSWAARTFGEEFADEISDIKLEFYRLGIASKPEHVHLCHFDYSTTQIEKRLAEYRAIYDRTVALSSRIPFKLKNAFYQLIEYPVLSCTDQNIKQLRARQSLVYAHVGQSEKALSYATESADAFREIVNLTQKYNTGISGGKWNRMMDYKPNNWSYHLMPEVATSADVAPFETGISEPRITIVPGGEYTSASSKVSVLKGLGIEGSSATVWPLDLRKYTNAVSAPYVEYEVPVDEGLNVIQVRCLPTFPLNTSYDLRAGISVNGASPSVISIKTSAMTSYWDETVAQGYSPAAVHYVSDKSENVKVRVYFMDPGLTVSAVASYAFLTDAEDLTDLLINPDFEYNASGVLNTQGITARNYPRGWRNNGTLKGNSWGINQDAKHIYGINVFWAASFPMPPFFELYQTIPSSRLTPGTYMVSCLLGVFKEKMANCRLFANQNVQYYGKESDYTDAMLSKDEVNTFAGYGPSGSGRMTLRPMHVFVTIKEGESLKLGIRSSNFMSDGSRSTSDNHGWFKVDHFRIQKLTPQDETAIRPVMEQQDPDAPIYNLSGQRVERVGRGIYIQNGRKVLR